MNINTSRISITEKLSYGFGDAGCNIVWQTAMLFLSYFYTDVYGLSPYHMGTMFLVVRLVDAFVDPLIGVFVDRKEFKNGRYRPYLKWFAIPFGITCALVFFTPNLGEVGKIIYAYVTYTTLSIVYSLINVPYCALGNALTRDSDERTSLQAYRFALTTISGLLVVLVALPLVEIIGKGNNAVGYFGAIGIMSVVAIGMFLTCYRFTKERYNDLTISKDVSLLSNIKDLMKSSQWCILFILNIVLLVAILVKNSTTLYYVNIVLKRPELATPLMVTGLACAVLGAIICPPVFNRFEKSKAYSGLIIFTGIASISLYFVNPENIIMVFVLTAIYGFVQMATSPLIWSMLADLADYESNRLGRVVNGVVFSTILFSIKAGIAIGGALVGWVLAYVNYIPGTESQTNSVLQTIISLYTIVPGLMMFGVAALLIPYKLNKNIILKIKSQFAKEHK